MLLLFIFMVQLVDSFHLLPGVGLSLALELHAWACHGKTTPALGSSAIAKAHLWHSQGLQTVREQLHGPVQHFRPALQTGREQHGLRIEAWGAS